MQQIITNHQTDDTIRHTHRDNALSTRPQIWYEIIAVYDEIHNQGIEISINHMNIKF